MTASAPEPRAVVFAREPSDAEPGATLLREFLATVDGLYGPAEAGAPTATPDELGPPHGAFLVGRLGGEPVACGGVKRLGAAAGADGTGGAGAAGGVAGPTAEIKRMYVRPAARGRGVARALLAALEEAARATGHRRVRLDTGSRQPDALHLYRSAGYRDIADYNGNARASYWLEKDL